MQPFQPTAFETFSEAYKHLAHALLDSPAVTSRGLETREILDVQFRIQNPTTSLDLSGSRLQYLLAEALWYAAGDYTLPWISKFSSFWLKLADRDGLISSNYGHRIFRATSTFRAAFEMLCRDPGSRQAICHINVPSDVHAANKDIPCTMYLQFFIRDSQLHLSVHMRSNDIWRGLTYDAPNFFIFQQTMLYFLLEAGYDLSLGSYTHHSGSFHIYADQLQHLDKYCNTPLADRPLQLRAPLLHLDGSPTTAASSAYREMAENMLDTEDLMQKFFI